MAKYLTEDQINQIIGVIVLPDNFYPMSQDSYNEELIAAKISKLKNPPELLMATINMATVGYGNQRYGNYRLGDQIVNIAQVFNTFQIKYNNPKNALLKDDDLTPGRLCRFYRHQVRNYIFQKKAQTYLWRKYSNHNPDMLHICFRGAEYLDDLSWQQADYYLMTIRTLDQKLGTNISERVERVFQAKNTKYTEV
jgi:hypothetical protein